MDCVEVETLVIGAGVVGLACARELALSGRSVWVLEQHKLIGSETSSRNSEVIHAGLYYPENSLKARLCVEGKRRLYDYAERKNIPYRRSGKLIVATNSAQLETLQSIKSRAIANDVDDIRWVGAEEVNTLEPELNCVGALLSPSTGIIDSHAYMEALKSDAEECGAHILMCQTLLQMRSIGEKGIEVVVEEASGNTYRVIAKDIVSACGLQGDRWLKKSPCFPQDKIAPIYFAKGNYFSLQSACPFSHLIYPVPEPGGLGVHLTLDMSGTARFGPDVEWVDKIDYGVSVDRKVGFVQEIKKYWPGLKEDDLIPDYSGIRPKLTGPGGVADFCVQGEAEHGVKGFVNLTGIESPGLTASLALSREVLALLDRAF